MQPTLPRQVLGRPLPAVLVAPLGFGWFALVWSCWTVSVGCRRIRLRKQRQLAGVESFAAWTIETTQQLVQADLDLAQLPLACRQGSEQLLDHPFEDGGIVRQVLDV